MCSVVEGQGLRTLEADMRCTGIIFKPTKEPFEHFCFRIAAEYNISIQTAREALVEFQK
jgi:hypothetical protein